MTRRSRQVMLGVVAGLCAALLLVELSGRAEARPALSTSPADWLMASGIVDEALDSDSPRRVELWRAAYAHAKLLAPHRPNANAAFVRGGLFHWYELGEEDRARVLNAAAPLMRDPGFFDRMHVPLLQLTGDFAWLRTHAPPTMNARTALRNLALSRGLFRDYQILREEIREARLQAFAARRRTDDPAALLGLLPERLDRRDERLVRGLLEEMDRQAFDPAQVSGRVEEVVDYALRHDLQPLTGVAAMLAPPSKLRAVTRARVALKLDQGSIASRIETTSRGANDAEWQPYYLDRARFEARRRDPEAANAYLARAAAGGMTVPVLGAAIDVARVLHRPEDEQRYRARLAAMPRVWQRLCGIDEICSQAVTQGWAAERRKESITLTNAQSDETPPYVEIYVDDMPMAEGEVRDTRTFQVPVPPGTHEIEIRLVNTHTRNGAQRRLRL
ncbi:MAG TPA: hypothetical protein VEO54_00150 [Thermoanaerobaculia bacterium]|nr:hypothetical protein [Thermoanaerobaculia bacterium]